MNKWNERSIKSCWMRLITLITLIVFVIGLVGMLPPAPVSAAGSYIDPVTMPRLTGMSSQITDIVSLSNDNIAFFYGAYETTPTPSLKVINPNGSPVFDKNLTAAFGSRATNRMSFTVYPIANGETIITVEGSTNGCDNNSGSLFAFLRVDASGNVATALTNISAQTRSYNCYTGMAQLSNGNLAFFYQITGSDYALRIFTPSGTPVTSEIDIEKTGTGNGTCSNQSSYTHTIAANKSGQFLITYYCYQNNNLYGVLFNDNGSQVTVGGVQHFSIGTFSSNNGYPSQSTMLLSDGSFMVPYTAGDNGTGYVFKKVSAVGVVTSFGSYYDPAASWTTFKPLGDGGFVGFTSRAPIVGSLYNYYEQGVRYSNTGALLEGPADLDTTYSDQCATDGSTCDSWTDLTMSSTVSAVGYNRGILYLNGRTHNLVMHSYLSAMAPTATTNAAASVTTTGATLNGAVNANNSSTTVTFQYGPTTSYGSTVTANESPVSGTSSTAVSKAITGLAPNTTYHFRVVAVSSGGTTNGTDLTFTTSAAAPTATTNAATSVTTTGATLNGTVNANNSSTTVTFEYGLTTSYGSSVTASQSPVTGTSNTVVSAALTGLTPNTAYHFRVVAVNNGGTTNGTDQTFTTSALAPTATTSAATSLTTTGATLNGTVNANGVFTTVAFEYGTTASYGSSVTANENPVNGASNTAVSKAITGLTPNTTYHFRVVAVSSGGTTNGTDLTFTTSALAPTATTNAAASVTTTGATLNGMVNANNSSATVTFEYGTTVSYGSSVTANESPVSGTSSTAVSKTITGLIPNTTYHFRVVAVSSGGTTNGTDLTFTTSAAAPTATTSAVTSLTATGATLNGTVNANNSSTTVTFQYGLTTSYGSTVTANESPVSGTSGTAVSKAISGLTSNTTYHFRVVAVNNGGTTNGTDQTFTTTAPAPAATTSAATSVTTTDATLNGTVNANNSSTTVTFEYGETTGYGSSVTATQSPVIGTSSTAVSKTITGLTPNTTYHFRVVAVNNGGTTNGADLTFTTSALAPSATTNAASAVVATGAMLNGTVNANNSSTTITFEYGTTVSYGSSVTANESPVNGVSNTAVSQAIAGLIPNTTYHFRVVAVNDAGTTNGADQTFTTPAAAPTATTSAVTSLTPTGATLNGTVNANNSSTTVTFEYGLTDSYGSTVTADESPISGTSNTSVSVSISGLTTGTIYHFRVVAVNDAGTTYGPDLTFTAGYFIYHFPIIGR